MSVEREFSTLLAHLVQVGDDVLSLKILRPTEHFGKARLLRRGPAGAAGSRFRGIVDGEGGFVQIRLKLETRFLQEALVIGLVRDGGHSPDGFEGGQPFEVDVEKSIVRRQETSRFWRGTALEIEPWSPVRRRRAEPKSELGVCV